jgi:hypothetical protein
MRHAGAIRASGGRVIGAGPEYLRAKLVRELDRGGQGTVARRQQGDLRGPRRDTRGLLAAQAFVLRYRVKPGAQPVRIA